MFSSEEFYLVVFAVSAAKQVIYNFLLEITKIMTGNDKQYTKVSNMKTLGRSFIPPAN